MTQSIIDIGDAPNDGTGDPVRDAFNKCNNNFTELYAAGSAVPAATTTPPQGRLTLQTATPVMTTTQSAKTTIYYTPYVGNRVPLYDGTNMVMTTFAELSVATTDTTKSPAAIGVSKVNDWFVWSDAGTVRIGHGPDWTSDTARSAGTALVMVQGIWLNNAAITNGPAASRGTYVGTTRSNASSQLDWIYGGSGVSGFFGIWNAYNRIALASKCYEATASWTYVFNVIRLANNSGIVRHSFVSGLAEDGIFVSNTININCASSGYALIGIQLDTSGGDVHSYASVLPPAGINPACYNTYPPQLGFHSVTAVEAGDNTTTTSFYSAQSGTVRQQFVLNWRA